MPPPREKLAPRRAACGLEAVSSSCCDGPKRAFFHRVQRVVGDSMVEAPTVVFAPGGDMISFPPRPPLSTVRSMRMHLPDLSASKGWAFDEARRGPHAVRSSYSR